MHLCVCCYKSLILVIVRRRISTTEALFLDFFKGLTVWPNWIQMFKHLMENKMYCAFRSTPTGWLVMLCGVFKGHLAALANIWHVFFLVYVCVVHTCYYSTPGLLSELASLTMLWGGGWLMQHVEPCETTALCPCVSLPGGLQDCRSVPCKPFPCSVSEQTCKQLRFPSEVVSGDGFLSCLPREGEEGEGGWEVRAADKSETCLVHAGTTKS